VWKKTTQRKSRNTTNSKKRQKVIAEFVFITKNAVKQKNNKNQMNPKIEKKMCFLEKFHMVDFRSYFCVFQLEKETG